MKTTKIRRVTSLLLVVVLALSLSVSASAAGNETITVTLEVQSTVDPTVTKEYTVEINEGESVEAAIKAANDQGLVSDWKDDTWLTSLIVAGHTYATKPYLSSDEYFDDGIYEGGDDILDAYDDEHGGIMLDGNVYLDAPGYYLFARDNYALYVGYDWMFKVDFHDGNGIVIPGEEDPSAPDGFRQYTMGETPLKSGDTVYLTYEQVQEVFKLEIGA